MRKRKRPRPWARRAAAACVDPVIRAVALNEDEPEDVLRAAVRAAVLAVLRGRPRPREGG